MDGDRRLIQNTLFLFPYPSSLAGEKRHTRGKGNFSSVKCPGIQWDKSGILPYQPGCDQLCHSAGLWQTFQVSESQIRIGFMRQNPICVVWHRHPTFILLLFMWKRNQIRPALEQELVCTAMFSFACPYKTCSRSCFILPCKYCCLCTSLG